MPQSLPTSDFYAHHSPFGAFTSFTLGRHGKKGGFGLELSGPAQQDVYVAYCRPAPEGEPVVHALPFYAGAQRGGAEAYTGVSDTSAVGPLTWKAFAETEITRKLGWA